MLWCDQLPVQDGLYSLNKEGDSREKEAKPVQLDPVIDSFLIRPLERPSQLFPSGQNSDSPATLDQAIGN